MILAKGSIGPAVRSLQASLNLLPNTELALLKVDGIFGIRTDGRVREFQSLNLLGIDGMVGPLTLAAIDLAVSLLKKVTGAIVVTQHNSSALTTTHAVSNPIVIPAVTASPNAKFLFGEWSPTVSIREFLFKIEKGGMTFWMGAATPPEPTDFSKAHVFLHPTVKQGKHVVAEEADYPDFKGGWSELTRPGSSLQRYVALEGGQLVWAGLKMPLLVPFTTMSALDPKTPGQNMFSDRPVETLNAVMQALQNATGATGATAPTLTKIGVTSFSSGISALRVFIQFVGPSGLIKEVIDLDGQVIKTEPKKLVRLVGATSKCFTQAFQKDFEKNYVVVVRKHFSTVTAYSHLAEGPLLDQRLHARIGWMMYYQAMLNTVVK